MSGRSNHLPPTVTPSMCLSSAAVNPDFRVRASRLFAACASLGQCNMPVGYDVRRRCVGWNHVFIPYCTGDAHIGGQRRSIVDSFRSACPCWVRRVIDIRSRGGVIAHPVQRKEKLGKVKGDFERRSVSVSHLFSRYTLPKYVCVVDCDMCACVPPGRGFERAGANRAIGAVDAP